MKEKSNNYEQKQNNLSDHVTYFLYGATTTPYYKCIIAIRSSTKQYQLNTKGLAFHYCAICMIKIIHEMHFNALKPLFDRKNMIMFKPLEVLCRPGNSILSRQIKMCKVQTWSPIKSVTLRIFFILNPDNQHRSKNYRTCIN